MMRRPLFEWVDEGKSRGSAWGFTRLIARRSWEDTTRIRHGYLHIGLRLYVEVR
jgi:hypothetical protein